MSWEIKIALGAELRVREWERRDWKLYHEHYWCLGLVISYWGGDLSPALLKSISIPSLSPLGVSSILPAVTATKRKKICPTRQNWFWEPWEDRGPGSELWAWRETKGLNRTDEGNADGSREQEKLPSQVSDLYMWPPRTCQNDPGLHPCKRPNLTTSVCLLLTIMLVSLCPAKL